MCYKHLFYLGLYYKSYIGSVILLTIFMMGLDEGAKLPFELGPFYYVDGELNSLIYYILYLQVGRIKNSPLNGLFYSRTLSG